MSTTPPREPWDSSPPDGGGALGGGPYGSSLPAYPGGAGGDEQWGSQQIGELAGWWSRVGATIIDGLIVGIVGLVFQLLLGRTAGEVLNFALEGLYLTFMIGAYGQTIGNRVVGTRVVAADGRSQVGYSKAALRWIVQPILVLMLVVPGLLDLLWPLWDPQHQTLHDKAAGTLVVRVR